MSNRKKLIQIIILIIIILGVGYYFLNEFYLSKPKLANLEELFEFKVVRQDLTQAQIDDYKNRFESNITQIQSSESGFILSSFNSMGMIKKILYDFEGAEKIWEYTGFKSPKNSLSFFNLGILYMEDLKDNKKAEKNFLIALENSEGERGNEQYYRMVFDFYTYYYPQKESKIEGILLDVLRLEVYQNNPDILSLLATYYGNNGQKEKALKYWQKVLMLNPDNEAVKNEIYKLE